MTFEVIKAGDGSYRWRLRGADGRVVRLEPGKVMLPAGSAQKTRKARAAVQRALAGRFKAQAAEG